VHRQSENQDDSAPTSPGNYSDSEKEMSRTKRDQAAKRQAQAAMSSAAAAQRPPRGGQGGAQEPQNAENGGAPRVYNMNVQMAHLLATLNQKPQLAAALAASGAHNHPALGSLAGQVTDYKSRLVMVE